MRKCDSGGILQVGTYILRQLHACPILEEDTVAGVTRGGAVLSEARLPSVHNEMCHLIRSNYTQGQEHYAELVMTMWFTAFLASNQISRFTVQV